MVVACFNLTVDSIWEVQSLESRETGGTIEYFCLISVLIFLTWGLPHLWPLLFSKQSTECLFGNGIWGQTKLIKTAHTMRS